MLRLLRPERGGGGGGLCWQPAARRVKTPRPKQCATRLPGPPSLPSYGTFMPVQCQLNCHAQEAKLSCSRKTLAWRLRPHLHRQPNFLQGQLTEVPPLHLSCMPPMPYGAEGHSQSPGGHLLGGEKATYKQAGNARLMNGRGGKHEEALLLLLAGSIPI